LIARIRWSSFVALRHFVSCFVEYIQSHVIYLAVRLSWSFVPGLHFALQKISFSINRYVEKE